MYGYLKEYLKTTFDSKIYIGTDSQNYRKYTAYAICIAVRNGDRGAHVLYHTLTEPKIKDRYARLWKEVEYSVELANQLVENEISVDVIELDFNKDKKSGSNMMIAAGEGYVKGLGYDVKSKPDELVATKAADHILRR